MENLPELYEIFQGEVANVTEYGAFIKIPGCRKQGLVHRTHMSSAQVDRPSEVVDVGERVWVKVIGREEIVCLLEFLRFPKNNLIQLQTKDGKEKISLSMKVVHQGTGKDLDSNNVMLEQDERKRREFKDYSKQKITLEAVLNTVCKKCGCKGHFAKDCFMQPGGTKYSLLPEEEEEDVKKDTEQVGVRSAKKKKKEKEKKKRKHSRDTQDSESDSSKCSNSDSSNSGPSKKKGRNEEKSRKTSKKKRKHKKHKHKHTGKDKN